MYSPDEQQLFWGQFLFAIVHFVWFVVYYSKYSTLNQKLSGIEKMERAGVVAREVIDASKKSVNSLISQLRKKCLLPNPVIALAHIVYLSTIKKTEAQDYLVACYILLGGIALVLMANVAKGREIFDPNKRFRGDSFNR